MQNYVLRVSMWVLGISALIGNIFVILMRLREKTASATQAVQAVTIGNLAISDFIMGIYMLIIASADLYYGKQYFVYSDDWRSGVVCKIAGFLALLSSEASVFFITLISIDRFLCVIMPFSRIRLGSHSCKIAVAIIWIITILIALIPTLYADPDSDIYDLSDVCIGLPLITRPAAFQIEQSKIGNPLSSQSFSLPVVQESKPAWYFSIVLFLGVNLACFLVICVCYTIMFIYVQTSRKNIQRTQKGDEDIKMAPENGNYCRDRFSVLDARYHNGNLITNRVGGNTTSNVYLVCSFYHSHQFITEPVFVYDISFKLKETCCKENSVNKAEFLKEDYSLIKLFSRTLKMRYWWNVELCGILILLIPHHIKFICCDLLFFAIVFLTYVRFKNLVFLNRRGAT